MKESLGPLQGRSLARSITLNQLCPDLRRQRLWERVGNRNIITKNFFRGLFEHSTSHLNLCEGAPEFFVCSCVWPTIGSSVLLACVYCTHQLADWWIPSSVVRLRTSYEGAGRGLVEKVGQNQYTYNASSNKIFYTF